VNERKIEGECYLKTRLDNLKRFYAIVWGFELYCFKNNSNMLANGDSSHIIMHTLKGTFVKKMANETWFGNDQEEITYYPLKIVLPLNKSRILFFATESEQTRWLNELNSTT
jgi:hypothetical protein